MKNLLGNPHEIRNKPTEEIIDSQLDTKLGHFTEEELEVVLKKKSRKASGLDEIPSEEWKTRKLDDILLRLCNPVNKQNSTEKWLKGYLLPLPKKGDLKLLLGITHLFPHNELVHLPYIAVATNTRAD